MSSRVRWSGESRRRYSNASSSQNSTSDRSYRTQSTAPTEYSRHRPQLQRPETCDARFQTVPGHDDLCDAFDEAQELDETYASSINSQDDIFDSEDDDGYSVDISTAPLTHVESNPEPYSSNSTTYGESFPPRDRMLIQHDAWHEDGNCALRLDTPFTDEDGTKQLRTLMYLSMEHDLSKRRFNVCRYGRDSGRQVVNTKRVFARPSSLKMGASGLQRALSYPFARESCDAKGTGSLRRTDSGYASVLEFDNKPAHPRKPVLKPTNDIKLEFSNYASSILKREVIKFSKIRYSYEYYGQIYVWKRKEKKLAYSTEVSFHLHRKGETMPIAHIYPSPLTAKQRAGREEDGEWIPPCSLWITDERLLNTASDDILEALIISGMVTLVDDTTIRKWEESHNRQFILQIPNASSVQVEFEGPRALIDHVFNRSGSKGKRNSVTSKHSRSHSRRISTI